MPPAVKVAAATANLDIFWLKDESLEDSANLPDPDIIAAEWSDWDERHRTRRDGESRG